MTKEEYLKLNKDDSIVIVGYQGISINWNVIMDKYVGVIFNKSETYNKNNGGIMYEDWWWNFEWLEVVIKDKTADDFNKRNFKNI